jgi:hypothetical protein
MFFKSVINWNSSAIESLGLHELKQKEPWYGEECLGFLDQTKQPKMQWIQDPIQSNADNLNYVKHEVSRHYRNKIKVYMELKLRNLKLTVRPKTFGTCIGASMTLRGTSLDVI